MFPNNSPSNRKSRPRDLYGINGQNYTGLVDGITSQARIRLIRGEDCYEVLKWYHKQLVFVVNQLNGEL